MSGDSVGTTKSDEEYRSLWGMVDEQRNIQNAMPQIDISRAIIGSGASSVSKAQQLSQEFATALDAPQPESPGNGVDKFVSTKGFMRKMTQVLKELTKILGEEAVNEGFLTQLLGEVRHRESSKEIQKITETIENIEKRRELEKTDKITSTILTIVGFLVGIAVLAISLAGTIASGGTAGVAAMAVLVVFIALMTAMLVFSLIQLWAPQMVERMFASTDDEGESARWAITAIIATIVATLVIITFILAPAVAPMILLTGLMLVVQALMTFGALTKTLELKKRAELLTGEEEEFESHKEFLKRVKQEAQAYASKVGMGISILITIALALPMIIKAVAQIIQTLSKVIVNALTSMMKFLIDLFKKIVDGIKNFMTKLGKAIVDLFKEGGILATMFKNLGHMFKPVIKALKGIFEATGKIISNIFKALKDLANSLIEKVKNAFKAFGDMMSTLFEKIKVFFQNVKARFTLIKDTGVFKSLKTAIKGLSDKQSMSDLATNMMLMSSIVSLAGSLIMYKVKMELADLEEQKGELMADAAMFSKRQDLLSQYMSNATQELDRIIQEMENLGTLSMEFWNTQDKLVQQASSI